MKMEYVGTSPWKLRTGMWSVSVGGLSDTGHTPVRNLQAPRLQALCSQCLGEFSTMDPMWKPYILSPENDDWIGVEDAVERKRLQNRLAQRAHRKKFGRKPGKRQKPHTLSTSEGQYLAGDKPGLTTTPRISQSRDSERGNKDSVGLDSLEVFDPFHTDGLETLHHQELDFVDERVLHPTSQPSNQFSFASSILTPLKGNLSHDSTYTINASIFDASFHPSPMIDSCTSWLTHLLHFVLLTNTL